MPEFVTNLLPYLILAMAPVLIMLTIAVKRNQGLVFWESIIFLLAAIAGALYQYADGELPIKIAGLFVIDQVALLYFLLVTITGLILTVFSRLQLDRHSGNREEYYILLLTSLLGASVLLASVHFASFFLGLEILTVSLYGLIAYLKGDFAVEAGIKYLILAAASSAFMLFGMGIVYLESGALAFNALAVAVPDLSALGLVGLGLIMVALGFKLAVVPFHLWTPDIYQASVPPVAALIATVSKGSMIAFFLRFSHMVDLFQWPAFVLIWSLIAVSSMLFGNILALKQRNLKRLIAYSSIAHLGYLMIGILAGTAVSQQAVFFYLSAYFLTILIVFGTMGIMDAQDEEFQEQHLRGLFWKQPGTAVALTLAFLSLAGIPLTGGFMGKYFLVSAGVESELWWVVGSLVIGSVIGLFYYLRLIMQMLTPNAEPKFKVRSTGYFLIATLAILLVVLGVYPTFLIDLLQKIPFF